MKNGSAAMFLTISLVIFFAGCLYLAWRISAGLNLHSLWIYAAFVFMGIVAFAALYGMHRQMTGGSFIVPVGYVFVGVWGILITVFILNDIVNVANLFLKLENFRYYSTVAAITVATALVVWSFINYTLILNITKVKIEVPNLPVESLRIVQLSDLHVSGYVSAGRMNRIFNKVEQLKPDMIVITGDVIDTDMLKGDKYKKYGFEKLKEMKVPYGVYAITGNHDHYAGLQSFYEMFERLGVKVLNNENVLVKNTINVAGINDIDHKNQAVIAQTLFGTCRNFPVLFLSHRPEAFDIASKLPIKFLQLSGHTHAGQIPPIEIARRFFMKFNYGIYRENGSVMYVTSGTRLWGPPMRSFNTSEIVVITLER